MHGLNYFRKLQLGKTVLIIDKDGKKHWIILDDEHVRDHNLMWWFDREYGKIIDMDATKEFHNKGNKNKDVNIKQMR